MEKMLCPYCGSENVRELTPDEKNELVREYGQSSNYKCDECDWLFNQEDIRWQELRHEISHRLIDTDEDHPVLFRNHSLLIGDKECDCIFQVPGEGTIWLHLVDEYDSSDPTGLRWHDIEECDFLTVNDLNNIVYHLKFD